MFDKINPSLHPSAVKSNYFWRVKITDYKLMYRYCNKGRHLEIKLVGKEKERVFCFFPQTRKRQKGPVQWIMQGWKVVLSGSRNIKQQKYNRETNMCMYVKTQMSYSLSI
jgi:hypothetical protein